MRVVTQDHQKYFALPNVSKQFQNNIHTYNNNNNNNNNNNICAAKSSSSAYRCAKLESAR